MLKFYGGVCLDSKRAKAIVSSPVMVNVTHNNSQVYMESVNDTNQTCAIHYLDKPDKKEVVPLSSLTEQ